MKKIKTLLTGLFLTLMTLTSFTSKSQTLQTTTLSTVSDFSDFTLGGDPIDNVMFIFKSPTYSPLTFTINGNKNVSFVNTFTSTNTFDSIVCKFDIYNNNAAGQYNGVYLVSGLNNKFIRVTNSNNIIPSFTITGSPTSTTFTLTNLKVVGYKTVVTTDIKNTNLLDNTITNLWTNSNKIFIKNLDNKNLKLNVLDISGKLVLNTDIFSDTIETNLPSGVYITQLIENGQVIQTKKVLINQ